MPSPHSGITKTKIIFTFTFHIIFSKYLLEILSLHFEHLTYLCPDPSASDIPLCPQFSRQHSYFHLILLHLHISYPDDGGSSQSKTFDHNVGTSFFFTFPSELDTLPHVWIRYLLSCTHLEPSSFIFGNHLMF